MSDPHDPQPFDPAAARIDALARQAGAELRRPAPADGISRAQRAKRTKQMTRLGGVGVAVVAIVGVGAFALNGGEADRTIVPATVSTLEPDVTVPDPAPDPTPDSAPDSTEPTPTSDAPPETTPTTAPLAPVGDPAEVYVAADFASFGSEVSTVDPWTGEIIRTFVVDDAVSEEARAAQDALVGLSALLSAGGQQHAGVDVLDFEVRVGALTYRYTNLPSEIPTMELQDPDALPLFDRCQQAELSVQGADGSALPARARSVVASPDGTRLAVVVSDCPVAGTLADGEPVAGADTSVLVFDASRPDLPGRTVVGGLDPSSMGSITFSQDGRFMAVEEFARPRLFDLAGDAVTEIDLVAELGLDDGCATAGTKWSRFIGPWIGGSSVAVTVSCSDGHRLVVRDLARADATLVVDVPNGLGMESFAFAADVDRASFERPETAWFTMCNTVAATCWVGQGSNPLVELPGQVQASFLPLGFEYGG